MQGGAILLETLALSMFIGYIASCYDCVANDFLIMQQVRQGRVEVAESCSRGYLQGTGSTSQVVEQEPVAFYVDASELSLVLATEDESGKFFTPQLFNSIALVLA